MTFDHIMVDLETLGNVPGSTILSIGAVSFNPYTRERGPVFSRNISRDSCEQMGLKEDPETLGWWQEPERAEAWALTQQSPQPVWQVLAEFADYWVRMNGYQFWCQGASYDLPLLEAAFRACALKYPWAYNAGRDTRTIYEISGVKPDKSTGVLHGALDDAHRQATAIERAYDTLGLVAKAETFNVPEALRLRRDRLRADLMEVEAQIATARMSAMQAAE